MIISLPFRTVGELVELGWHSWFAWHPVFLSDDRADDSHLAWLCIVERQCTEYGTFVYRKAIK